LVACSSNAGSKVFRDICNGGLSRWSALGRRNHTSLLAADADGDGFNEIVVAAHGNLVLMKEMDDKTWRPMWRMKLMCPVFSIVTAQVTGDGVSSAAILASDGVHLFGPKRRKVQELIQSRAKMVR